MGTQGRSWATTMPSPRSATWPPPPGLRHIHLFSWRDLADVEAGGSEVHAANVARLWARPASRSPSAPATPRASRRPSCATATGSCARRVATWCSPGPSPPSWPAAWAPRRPRRVLERHAVLLPLWERHPSIVVLHHVHAEMWKMVLGDDNPRWPGRELEEAKVARCSTGGAASSPCRPPRRTTSWSRSG